MKISPLAGKSPTPDMLVDVQALIKAYYEGTPDADNPEQKVQFGTSGHRGSSFNNTFNENHILAISQAICMYRELHGIDGPLFVGIDTHALSKPALKSALEVLGANGVTIMVSEGDEFTPTPVISHAILTYNKGRERHLADGIVITPSHNPPAEGGFKYNPPNGGPAETDVTNWIQDRANQFLKQNMIGIKRIAAQKVVTHKYNYHQSYISDLKNVIDFDVIRKSNIRIGVDPLGGAGVHYWKEIAETYGINLTVVNETVDPTFRFMTVDWDGKIRMDPSSSYAMQGLIKLKDQFDIAFACDTDHDRHGIVTKSKGLIQPNHYMSVCIDYLFKNRPAWSQEASVGKTLVSSEMMDRVARGLKRKIYEVPVGFKWFVDGLLSGMLAFTGEESAGGSFLRKDGTVWTTDKDGIILALLAAEITARIGKDPGEIYEGLTETYGNPLYDRVEGSANREQKAKLKKLTIHARELAGEKIEKILTHAPGNGAPIGGIKVEAANGWFAARPSGTEDIYKIYAESFKGKDHLDRIVEDARRIVDEALN